jgi:nucleoside-diphosphate-sugar epimerase
VNVEGTRRCLELARSCGVQRFVHCSTVGVAIGPGSPPFDEDTPYHQHFDDKYERTKCEAEVVARSYASDQDDLSVVVVRPAQVYGPGDMSKLKLYKLVKRGVIVDPSQTWKHLIYVDDLCRALELASIHENAPSNVFIAASEHPTRLTELIDLVAEVLGVHRPRILIPAAPVTTLCAAVESVCDVMHVKPPIFRRSMDFFTRSMQFDTSRIRSVLGFETRTGLREGIRRTADWYRERGLI